VFTKIDFLNAYNLVDYKVLKFALSQKGINHVFVNYFETYLNLRNCLFTDNITCGLSQGDPLSSHAFCIVMDLILYELE
jgi:hypothetical protein